MTLVDSRFSPLEIFRAEKYAQVLKKIDVERVQKRVLDMAVAEEWLKLPAREKLEYLDKANQLALVYIGKKNGYDAMKRAITESECFKERKLHFNLDRRRGLARICCTIPESDSEVSGDEDDCVRIYRVDVPHVSSRRRTTPEVVVHRRRQPRMRTDYDVTPADYVIGKLLRRRGLDPDQSRRRHIQQLRSDTLIGCHCQDCSLAA